MPNAAEYAKRKAEGKCSRCAKPSRVGKTMCLKCMRISAALDRKHKAKLMAEGKCSDCGGIKDEADRHLCAHCQERNTYHRTRLNHMKR